MRILPALVLFGALSAPSAEGPDLAILVERLDASTLDLEGAVDAAGVDLALDYGGLHFESGVLVPARGELEGRTHELVFVGRGRLRLEAPDEVEAEQLAFATGKPSLDVEVVEAVLIFGDGRARDRLAGRTATAVDAATTGRASELFRMWVEDAEREGFGARKALLKAALGDSVGAAFVGAWLRSPELGRIYYRVDPGAEDPVELGSYELFDREEFQTQLERRRERKRERSVERYRRRAGQPPEIEPSAEEDRPCGAKRDDAADDDEESFPWIRTAAAGQRPGADAEAEAPGLEPEHYAIELSLEGDDLRAAGTARVRLRPTVDGLRAVELRLAPLLDVCEVLDSSGAALSFDRREWVALVALPQPTRAGETLELSVRFAGEGIRRLFARRLQRHTKLWHPHVGLVDRATYDVTLSWPAGLALLSSGAPSGAGVGEDGRRWERRRLDVPALGFSFEIDDFDVVRDHVGHLDLEFGFPRRDVDMTAAIRLEIVRAVKATLLFYESRLGLLPIDRMTVVVAARGFSQGFLGFVTLAEGGQHDALLSAFDNRSEQERRLETIAHEISHQWWGNVMGWSSYRDQWLSEALADFSAAGFMTQIAPDVESYRRRRAEVWRTELAALTKDGRPLASLGPVVLGRRLAMNYGLEAYSAIVYAKGSVVFSTLAQRLGEAETWRLLGTLARAVNNRTIATSTFFRALEHMSGQDLGGFVRQYVRGSGLPQLFWSHSVRHDEDAGSWIVDGTLELFPGVRYRYAVRPVGAGWDAVRRMAPPLDVSGWTAVVPYRADLADGATQRASEGTLTAGGAISSFSLTLDARPVALRLDPHGENLAELHDGSFDPKRQAFERGTHLSGLGRLDEAAAVLAEALSAAARAPVGGTDPPDPGVAQRLDCRVRLALARLALDRGDVALARKELALAEDLVPKDERDFWAGERAVLAARRYVQLGDGAAARASLAEYLSRHGVDAASVRADRLIDRERLSALRISKGEVLAVEAIAAWLLRDSDAATFVQRARLIGVDMSALSPLTP